MASRALAFRLRFRHLAPELAESLSDPSFLGGAWRPRLCRPMGNAAAIFVILDAVVMAFCAAVAIGEMLLLRERIRKRRPANSRAVVTASLSMLVSGITGIAFMRAIC